MAATIPDREVEGLRRRIEGLERQNRRTKLAAIGTLFLVGMSLLLGQVPWAQAQSKAGADEPKPLVVRDKDGKERLWLGMGKDGPGLIFHDEDGKSRAEFGSAKGILLIRLVDASGQVTAGMAVQKDGISLVSSDKDGKLQTGVNAIKLGPGLIVPQPGEKPAPRIP
jgi:hypothetical protein